MNSIETSSAFSAYTSSMSSFSSVTPVKGVDKADGENSDVKLLGSASKSDEIKDEAIISDEANSLFESEQAEDKKKAEDKNNATSESEKDSKSDEKLTKEQQTEITKLKARDAEVRAHEQAHLAAAAGISASAPSFSYEAGPDGRRYAVGGEVSISFSETENPNDNIMNAMTMKAAALAPANPSSQDYNVARSADALIATAREEISAQQQEKLSKDDEDKDDTSTTISGEVINPTTIKQDDDNDKDDKPLLVRT